MSPDGATPLLLSDLLPLVEDPALLPALLPGSRLAFSFARDQLRRWLTEGGCPSPFAVRTVLEDLVQLTPEDVVLRGGLSLDGASDLLMAAGEALDLVERAGTPGLGSNVYEADAATIRAILAEARPGTLGEAVGAIEQAGWMQTGGAESKQESRVALLHIASGRRIAVIFPLGPHAGREVRFDAVASAGGAP